MAQPAPQHRRTVLKSVLTVIGMFGFGFALVPLYEVFCEVTGLNGKTGGRYVEYDAASVEVDTSRTLRVQFITTNNENMPWQFKPVTDEVSVHPGELKQVEFYVKNVTDQPMAAKAVPSISPTITTDFFHKTECFCFNEQVLQPGESLLMPMRFFVGNELPDEVRTMTLSYTLFDITEAYQEVNGALVSATTPVDSGQTL